MKKLKKTKKMMARTEAIELFANNVKIDNKTVAERVGVSAPTLRYWLSDPEFSETLYKRYIIVIYAKQLQNIQKSNKIIQKKH